MNNIEKIKPNGLFTNYIYKAIPLAFDESLSYYECLCGLLDYLKNTVIPAVNNNADAVIELQNLYIELKDYVDNYFTNLDVQQEINNKLDEMVEEGTLQEIIGDYLNSKAVFGFDTVSDLQQATNLINGSFAKTMGYYSVNDGGSALYKIRNFQSSDLNNILIISLNNNLVAELIVSSEINIDKLGAKGNGTNDDTLLIQKAIDYCITNQLKLTSSGNKTYLISDSLNIDGIINIDFNNSILITNESIKMIDINHQNLRKGGYIKNIIIDCNNVALHGIYCTNATKQLLSNIEIINISNIGFELNDGVELIFENSHLRGSSTSLSSIGLKLNRGDSHYKDLILVDCHTAIVNSGSNFFDRIHAWILTPTLLENSIFMRFNGTRSFLSQCYSDTYHYGFYIESDGRLRLVEHNNYYNSTIITPSIISQFTDNKVYMFYYTNSSYTRSTTITNSFLQGYADNTALSNFTNVTDNDNRMFIDSQSRIANWSSPFKIINIDINSVPSEFLSIPSGQKGKIKSINNICNLSIPLTNPNIISANNSISNIYQLENLLRPTIQKIFVIPYTTDNSFSTISGYCMGWINTNGQLNLSTPNQIPANSILYVDVEFICNREP